MIAMSDMQEKAARAVEEQVLTGAGSRTWGAELFYVLPPPYLPRHIEIPGLSHAWSVNVVIAAATSPGSALPRPSAVSQRIANHQRATRADGQTGTTSRGAAQRAWLMLRRWPFWAGNKDEQEGARPVLRYAKA